jgi:hypothetical protein
MRISFFYRSASRILAAEVNHGGLQDPAAEVNREGGVPPPPPHCNESKSACGGEYTLLLGVVSHAPECSDEDFVGFFTRATRGFGSGGKPRGFWIWGTKFKEVSPVHPIVIWVYFYTEKQGICTGF